MIAAPPGRGPLRLQRALSVAPGRALVKARVGENYALFQREGGGCQIACKGQPLYLCADDWGIGALTQPTP